MHPFDLLAYLFYLLPFVAVVLALTSIWLFKIRFRTGVMYNKPRYFFHFLWVGLAAMLTQWSYVCAPQRIFTNAEHHVLERLGFTFGDQLTLADEQHPEQAIWDTRNGRLRLQYRPASSDFQLRGEDFIEPIFTQTAPHTFTLQNPVFDQPIRQQFSIELDTTQLQFRLQFDPDSTSSFRVVQRGTVYGPFSIPVKMPLQKGYSLAGLLAKTHADVPGMGELITALDSVYLLRKEVSDQAPEQTNKIVRWLTSKLGMNPKAPEKATVLFPSARLLRSSARIRIDNQVVQQNERTRLSVSLSAGQSFYLGLWSTLNPVFTLRRAGNESEWRVNFPQREYLKPLKQENESLFLTSSAPEVTKSEQMAGFYFPLFDRDDNVHHISANLSYQTASTRKGMQFRILNYDQNSLDGEGVQTVAADSVFRVASRGVSQGHSGTNWLFRIHDLKASNPLQLWHMLLLTLLIVGSIYGCMLLTPDNRQSKTEYITYMLVLVLMTIRSILLWRVSTFLPVEDASPTEYRTLAQLGWSGFRLGAGFCFAFFALVAIWKVWHEPIRQAAIRLTNRVLPKTTMSGLSSWLLLGFSLYALALLVKLAGGRLERIGAVYLPLLVYFTLDFAFLKALTVAGRSAYKDPDYRLLTRTNWFICLGYLALADAGFSIIFLVSTMVFNLIRELTFPRKTKRWVIPRTAIVWGGVLIAFIWGSPYLLSGLFRYTRPILFGAAGICLLYGGWEAFRRRPVTIFGRLFPFWTLPALSIMTAALIIGLNGKILEKVESKSYARYRSEILIASPDEIIKREEFNFNQGKDSELLRAAQNQWLINYFAQQSDWMPHHYFRLLPSFKKGSPYLTQICDLVTVRYVIGEHTQLVVTLLLSLMIVLMLSAADADTPFNRFSILRLKLLSLLFATGLFVWMAATNRIIFLGQDFPLLSLNSLLTCLFTFTILLVVFIWGEQARLEPASLQFSESGQQQADRFLRGGMLFFIFVLLLLRPHQFSEKKFDLEGTIAGLQTAFDDLNVSFAQYQLSQRTVENRVPLATVVQRFSESPDAPGNNKGIFKNNTFASSAYRAYVNLLTHGENDPDNLIHVRRRNDDLYQFAVNRLFYNVSSPDVTLDAWRGHILSETASTKAGFVNRQTNQSRRIDIQTANASLEDTLNGLFRQSANNNLYLTYLPASWSPDSLPIVIVSQRQAQQAQNRASFVVKSGQDIYRSNDSPFAVALQPNDVVQFRSAVRGQGAATLQYQYQPRQYFAKNVWMNGHQQFFYPLGAKFLWTYHFANLVKSKYELEANSHLANVQLSLDPRLTEDVSTLAADYFRENKWGGQTEQARAFNLVVMGSDGKVRALCDYKKGATPQIDPNRMSRYQDLFTSLYLNAQTDRERMLFGNRCLMRMDNGPASTFKPILYSAVTSQYNFDWERLEFGGLSPSPVPDFLVNKGSSSRILRFGDRRINFLVDNGNLGAHNMNHYISGSTNTYNSMMVFLGSLTNDQIRREQAYVDGAANSARFLVRGRSADPTQNFPLLRLSTVDYHLRAVEEVDYMNAESLLGKGLWHNFDMPVQPEHVTGRAVLSQNLAPGLDTTFFNQSRSSNRAWSFPEPSHLYLLDRNDLQKAIVQCATGADPINATPFKMAEMAASLFSFNRSFQASVLANHRLSHQDWQVDDSWRGASNLTSFYSRSLFNAMHNSIAEGTAHALVGLLTTEFGGYHFYAKTGTISGGRDNGKRDKHLMLVISRTPLHGRTLTPNDLKNNRFMVLYFSFYKQSEGAEWGSPDDRQVMPTVQNMIRAVLHSDSFTNLMAHEPEH